MSTKNDAPGETTNHIPGIYNYCDRWCERCPFTSRCLNFEMSAEKFGDLENLDINNEVFWQKLSETFQETLSMLKEMAAEKGIDLDSIEVDDDDDIERGFDDPSVVHICSHMAKSYITLVDDWFDSNVYIFEDGHSELKVVVGDSPQFSALTAQTAPRELVGSALTIVTSIGFFITIISIQFTNFLVGWLNIQVVFLFLVPGPIAGLVYLWPLFKGFPNRRQ